MLKQKKISENEQGSALVYTLMVLLLLSLLAISVGMVTVGSYKLSDSNRDYTSAYYIAEAGANQVKSDFTKKVNDLYTESITEGSFIDAVNKEVSALKDKVFTYPGQFNEEVKGKINVAGNFNDGYTIISEGQVGNKTRIVEIDFKVKWIDKSGPIPLPTLPPDAAILAKNKLSLTGGGALKSTAYISSKDNDAIELLGAKGGNQGRIVYPEGVTLDHISNVSKPSDSPLKMESKNVEVNWDAYGKILDQIKTEFNKPIVVDKSKLGKLRAQEVDRGYGNKHDVVDSKGSVFVNHWLIQDYEVNLKSDTYIPEMIISPGKKVLLKGSGNIVVYLDKLELKGGNTSLDIEVDGNVTIIVGELNASSSVINITSNKNLTIVVDDLKVMSSAINITNDRNVTMIVNKTMAFNPTSSINSTKSPKQLLFVYRGATPNFSNLTTINANIFSINNTDRMTIQNSEINGVIVTDSESITFSRKPYPKRILDILLIAPSTEIVVEDGFIEGTLIGKTVTLTDGGDLTAKDIDTAGFYFENKNEGSSNEGSSGDLITSSPIIEPK
ncbi:PilX N-terminal domain-containing pilus assembly protein [Jeotgalibaca porci]|uniref:PilX N-terminal domain-containing pilus assembly protein n=1 Tax=Jeotgalibaca porci TaxID=1868793 RepID=UPI003F8E8E8E